MTLVTGAEALPYAFQIVGIVLITTATVMIVAGATLLGWIKDVKSAGIVQIACGGMTLVMGLYLAWGIQVIMPAGLCIMFGIAQTLFGVHNYIGAKFDGLGWLSVVFAIGVGYYVYWFFSLGFPTWGALCITWFLIFVFVACLVIHAKPFWVKVNAIWLLLTGFITLLAPGLITLSQLYAIT